MAAATPFGRHTLRYRAGTEVCNGSGNSTPTVWRIRRETTHLSGLGTRPRPRIGLVEHRSASSSSSSSSYCASTIALLANICTTINRFLIYMGVCAAPCLCSSESSLCSALLCYNSMWDSGVAKLGSFLIHSSFKVVA